MRFKFLILQSLVFSIIAHGQNPCYKDGHATCQPNLQINGYNSWERYIQISLSNFELEIGVEDHTRYRVSLPLKNSFITFHKISKVEICLVKQITKDSSVEYKDYEAFYDTLGNLSKQIGNIKNGSTYTDSFIYNKKGFLVDIEEEYTPMTFRAQYLLEREPLPNKTIKSWTETRFDSNCLCWSYVKDLEFYYCSNGEKDYYGGKLSFFYSKEGLLSEIKRFSEDDKLKYHYTFRYTFFKPQH